MNTLFFYLSAAILCHFCVANLLADEPQACNPENKSCAACRGELPALKGRDLAAFKDKMKPGWEVVNEHQLEKTFTFPDFKSALSFTNKVGALAETMGHHPDICLSWGKVKLVIWTHKVDGLTETDFDLANKSDALY